MSPPWGGTGYNLVKEYTMDLLYPEFDSLIKKGLEFSNNMIIFLPRNSSVDDIINRLVKYSREFSEDPETRLGELVLEIEQI